MGWISQPLSNKNTQPMKYHPCQPRHAALALLLVGLAAPTAQAALPAGTQGYYSFNNAADLGADLSANANHLSTASGAPSFSASGKFGGALYLDGSSSMTTAAGFPTGFPTGTASYTLAVWEKLDTGASEGSGFIGWGNHNWWRSPLGQFDQAAAVESTTGSMIMLAITYQDLGGGNVRITGYRNGVQMGSYDSAHIASWAANDQVVVFGPRTLTDGALDALVHEARLYDKTCSAAEIQALNTAGPLATSAFNTWVGTAAGGRGLSGAAAAFDADPDGDGIPNGIEFVIGGEPNPANPGANSCGLLPAASNLGTDFVFTYLLSNEAASLNPLVEFDTDLQGEWTTAVDGVNATIVVTPGDPAATVTVTIPQGAKRELFARLKVTQP